jgi:hypothetical protein
VPDTHLELLFDEVLAAPTTEELIVGIYEKTLPAIRTGMQRHIADTNPDGRPPVCPRVQVRADGNRRE